VCVWLGCGCVYSLCLDVPCVTVSYMFDNVWLPDFASSFHVIISLVTKLIINQSVHQYRYKSKKVTMFSRLV
jgi:hypothetical protein